MPLELGIFLGAKYFGGSRQRAKACVVFDRERFRYQRFCSDIAGLDVRAHHGDERALIRGVRDALRSWSGRALPSGSVIFARYTAFTERLPELAWELRLDPDELAFGDLTTLAALWIATNEN
jgi:hypothetical protein